MAKLFERQVSMTTKMMSVFAFFLDNKTELFGQIFGPPGGAVRNLVNLILSINVAYKKHVLHTSIQPITYPLFPLDYAVEIDEKHLPVENIPHLEVMAAIWQPAYVHETVILLTNETVESLNITMQAIRKSFSDRDQILFLFI